MKSPAAATSGRFVLFAVTSETDVETDVRLGWDRSQFSIMN